MHGEVSFFLMGIPLKSCIELPWNSIHGIILLCNSKQNNLIDNMDRVKNWGNSNKNPCNIDNLKK